MTKGQIQPDGDKPRKVRIARERGFAGSLETL